MTRMFGTDVVRGIANAELDGLLAYRHLGIPFEGQLEL